MLFNLSNLVRRHSFISFFPLELVYLLLCYRFNLLRYRYLGFFAKLRNHLIYQYMADSTLALYVQNYKVYRHLLVGT